MDADVHILPREGTRNNLMRLAIDQRLNGWPDLSTKIDILIQARQQILNEGWLLTWSRDEVGDHLYLADLEPLCVSTVYHAAPVDAVPSIVKQGLKPSTRAARSGSIDNIGSIFFCRRLGTPNELCTAHKWVELLAGADMCDELGLESADENPVELRKRISAWAILEFDLSDLGLLAVQDPWSSDAVLVMQQVSPGAFVREHVYGSQCAG